MMLRWITGSVGLSLAINAPLLLAQTPSPSRPAVRLAAVRALDNSDLTARSQMGTTQTPTLPQPRPFGTPSVSEQPPIPAPTLGPGAPINQYTPTNPYTAPSVYNPQPGVYPGVAAPGTTYVAPGATYAAPGTYAAPMNAAPAVAPLSYIHRPAGPVVIPTATADGGLLPTPNMDPPLYGNGPGPGLIGIGGTPAVQKWWMSAEYLMWWTKSAQFPVLLTTSSPQFNGIPGTGNTTTVFGGDSFGQTLHGGGRFGMGYWFGCDQCFGVEGSVFFLGRNGNTFVADSSQYPVLARPFINLNTNQPFSELVASNELATGGAQVNYENSLWGAEANFRRRMCGNCYYRTDFLFGFRYLQLNEQLQITESFARTPTSPASVGVPDAISGVVIDRFKTNNQFYGGQIGFSTEARRGRWFASLTGKVALGTVFQMAMIEGSQSIQLRNGSIANANGGLLAIPGANIGTYRQTRFGVMPEVGVQFGYHLTRHCRIFMGYNFMYLNSVLRPGDQIDTGLDVTRIPNFPLANAPAPLPTTHPTVPLNTRDFFAQGLNFGIQFTW